MIPKGRIFKGQVLVLYALAILVLIAVVGLLLDGGQAYLHRRTAQAAADAGALAGAYDMCINKAVLADALATAEQYAEVENPTDDSTASYQDGKFFVTTVISKPSFFFKIFGIPQVNVSSQGVAGCYYPGSGQEILPVAWSCRDAISGSDSQDCMIKLLDWDTQLLPMIDGGSPYSVTVEGTSSEGDPVPGQPGMIYPDLPYDFKNEFLSKYLYVVMDSGTTANETCAAPYGTGSIDCDIDDDGKVDLLGAGDRSWLDLDGGGGGASSLRNWIQYGYAPGLQIHQWVSGASGVQASTFQAVADYQCNWCNTTPPGRPKIVVGIPVFNATCTTYNPLNEPACLTYAHRDLSDTDTVVHLSGNNELYYHVIGFARFYITCVDTGGSDHCPGHAWAQAAGMKPSMKTIEGYFVDGYPNDDFTGTGGAYLGTITISLVNPEDTD